MNHLSVQRAADPTSLPGWDQLGANASFYACARWLAYADVASGASSEYLVTRANDLTIAALSIHRLDGGFGAEYNPAIAIPDACLSSNAVLIGGYRGYRSSVLKASRADVSAAVTRTIDEGVRDAEWWWPHLTFHDASFLQRAFAAEGRDTSLNFIGVDHSVRSRASFESHVTHLPSKQRRTNARREHSIARELGIRVKRLRLAECWDSLVPLLAGVEAKYGNNPELARLRRLVRLQAEHLDDIAMVFGCEDTEGRLIGFSLCYRGANELALRIVGFDYDHLRGGEYSLVAIYEPLVYAAEHGIRNVHLGIDSDEAKVRRGSVLEPLWAVSSHGESAHAASVARARSIAAGLPEREAAALLGAVESALGYRQ
ncbi:Peptidogalycan biosysnthesis/recognition [Plantibacter flavus]|uniref:Peptidoglycan biosynthesis/recognition protein n=1 Tax=Plantibacter flavus TaxID=150123 RepID=A0A3N2C7T2_9MICO|nr:GNAT family N-acetyltransferase [Plantibacter flavus]ROR83490.1 peptidoglycan biosynthesis/recognition protein [Plantibacter flavus]SMG24082.1 Peptidogalycan biosysnthesis/recognition [Plantibacter flavus]